MVDLYNQYVPFDKKTTNFPPLLHESTKIEKDKP